MRLHVLFRLSHRELAVVEDARGEHRVGVALEDAVREAKEHMRLRGIEVRL